MFNNLQQEEQKQVDGPASGRGVNTPTTAARMSKVAQANEPSSLQLPKVQTCTELRPTGQHRRQTKNPSRLAALDPLNQVATPSMLPSVPTTMEAAPFAPAKITPLSSLAANLKQMNDDGGSEPLLRLSESAAAT